MTAQDGAVARHRNRNYETTHEVLIERAAELIADSGADGVSLCALSRATGINRSTVYYHFENREVLMTEAREWSSTKTAAIASAKVSSWHGIDEIATAFQCDPEVVSSWVDNDLVGGVIRQRYPQWDRLVAQIGAAFAELGTDDPCDPEVYYLLLRAGASIARRSITDTNIRPRNLGAVSYPASGGTFQAKG